MIDVSRIEDRIKLSSSLNPNNNNLSPRVISLSNDNSHLYAPAHASIPQREHRRGRTLTNNEQMHTTTDNSPDKPRSSRSQGAKFFFFPFFKKVLVYYLFYSNVQLFSLYMHAIYYIYPFAFLSFLSNFPLLEINLN